ncbi:MAG: hypothetical protein U5K81_01340 [Trueperaceae bacterium]|nr:hypothetical protein [Trueperaceae bacterium]
MADPRAPHMHGTTVDAPVHTEDLPPTLLALARPATSEPRKEPGTTGPASEPDPAAAMPGADLTPCCAARRTTWRARHPLQFVRELRPGHPFHDGGWRGFRTARYKATWRASPEGVHLWQTFDLHDDPFERHDRHRDSALAGVRRDLQGALHAWQVRNDDDFEIGDAP